MLGVHLREVPDKRVARAVALYQFMSAPATLKNFSGVDLCQSELRCQQRARSALEHVHAKAPPCASDMPWRRCTSLG